MDRRGKKKDQLFSHKIPRIKTSVIQTAFQCTDQQQYNDRDKLHCFACPNYEY